jgi:hypothetical protein
VPAGLTFAHVYTWSGAGTCLVECQPHYTKSNTGNIDSTICSPCRNVNCGIGEEEIICTTDMDTFCEPCVIPFEHGVFRNNEEFIEAGSCKTKCKPGHYRAKFANSLYSPCVACTTLDEIFAVLALTTQRTLFFEFVPCTGTSDLFERQCEIIVGNHGNHIPIADANETERPCQYECPSGTYYHDSASVRSVSITPTQQPTIAQLVMSNSYEELITVYDKMRTAYCTDCPLPWQDAVSGTYTWLLPSNGIPCPFECVNPYVWWVNKCQQCPTDCGAHEYTGGEITCECLSCDLTQYPNSNWEWNAGTQGTLGNNVSCSGHCKSGYFRNGVQCLLKSIEPSGGCGTSFFWHTGSDVFDATCLPCQSCEGMWQSSPCDQYNNAQCQPCDTVIDSSEQFVGITCSVVCRTGFVRDQRSIGTNECEDCRNVQCSPGTRLAASPTHCSDCVACAVTKPLYAHWVFDCEYACNVGRIFQVVTDVHEDGTELTRTVCAVDKSGFFTASHNVAGRKNVRCVGSEVLGPDYQCRPCTVVTPPLKQLNSTWNWLLSSCQWECKQDRLLYIDIVNAKHCLTWTAFQSTVLARQDAFNVRFSVVQHVVPRLSMNEILCCMAVLSVCVGLQVWF